jgi:cysteine protease ATG4
MASLIRYAPAVVAWLYDETVNIIRGSLHVGVKESISFLGVEYAVSDSKDIPTVTRAIQDDYESRIFLPYRKGFAPLVNPDNEAISPAITTDSGWGCIVRSMQMATAQGLVTLALGRDFRKSTASAEQMEIYRQIAYLFADRLDAPLSIHNFSRYSQEAYGRPPKGWFSPIYASFAVSELWENAFHKMEKVEPPKKGSLTPASIDILVLQDGDDTVYETVKTSVANHPGGTIVLHNLQLDGISDQVIHDYIHYMFSESKTFQGIVGGALWRGYYFVGADQHKMYFMDPHETRDAILNKEQLANLETITSHSPNRMRWTRLSRSVTFVFAFKNLADVEEFDYLMKTIPLFSTYTYERDPHIIAVNELNRTEVDEQQHSNTGIKEQKQI